MSRALMTFALTCVLGLSACWSGDLDFAEVRRLQAEGRGAETIDPLRETLAEDPDDREASLLLGTALAQSKRYGEAMFHLRRAARDGEFADEAGLLLGATLLLLENHEAAIEAVDAVLERDPSLAMGWMIRGQAALQSARPEIALESAQRVLALNPNDFAARIIEAGAFMAQGDRAEAERAFAALFGLAPEIGPEAVATACTEYARFQLTLLEEPERTQETLDSCRDVLIQNALWVDAGARLYQRAGNAKAASELAREALAARPEDQALRILVAEELRRAGRTQEAEAELVAGTELSQSAPLWVALSKLRRERGDPEGALDAIDRALAVDGGDTETLRFHRADLLVELARLADAREAIEALEEPVYRDIVAGRIAQESGDAERALTLFEGALQQWPDHAGVRILAARAAHELGEEERALDHLVEATRAAPADTDASLLLARLHLLRGDTQLAYNYARRHLEYRGNGNPEALRVAARAAAAADDLAGARTSLEALAAHPAQSALGVSELAAFLAETEGARAALDYVAETGLDLSEPENEPVLRRAVRLELDAGNPEAAIARIDAVLAKHPDAVSALALRAHVLRESGDPAAARAGFEAALAVDPEHAESNAGMASLALAAGDPATARAGYERAVEAAPGEPAYRYGLAQALLAAGDADAAERELRLLLRTHPEHAAAANDLAWLLALRGEALARALQLAERAVRTAPSPETRDTLGFVHLRAGRISEAREAFEAALAERPGYGTARYHLALAHLEQGDEDAAREALRTALAGEPFSEAEEARAALARLGE